MNILLFAPGFALLTFQAVGFQQAVVNAFLAFLVQVTLAVPFLIHHPTSYLIRAFDFGRVFLYKWTVNWRFMDESSFLSKSFANGLLAAHVLWLALFIVKWCKPYGGLQNVLRSGFSRPGRVREKLPADHIMFIMFTSNLIGVTCARSLHYQFWSWYAHGLPYLVWRLRDRTSLGVNGLPAILGRVLILATLEYAWNKYPSTSLSSGLMLGCHLVLLVGLAFTADNGTPQLRTRQDALKDVDDNILKEKSL
ncbi:dolichyl-P-Man:Man5GlcNAc2-PP-dolichol alpha-1,3-mannosyltransferase [Spizellomyces sp. 'palustris']|nr:dolichyl-P-Man:Man5GlcNAc2-PP-dolichol alpha-1,3-mannosyltransferase [Spizellomyces sp. 'palustris']